MNREPFLKNPCVRKVRKVRKSRKGGKKMSELFLLNRPKKPKMLFSPLGISKKRFEQSMPSSMLEGGIVEPIRRKRRKAKIFKPAAPKRHKRVIRRGVVMARRKGSRKGKVTQYGKIHSLTVYRRGSGYQVARHSRLVRNYRGRIINPIIPSRGELMTVAGITGGFVASRYLPRMFDRFLPPMLNTGLGKVAVQTATGLGVSWLVGNMLKQRELGSNIATGTLLNAAVSLVDMYILKGVLAEEGIAALAENVPEVVGEAPGDTPATLPAGFSDEEDAEMSAGEQDVIVM
jgi:hypothetical protein